MKKPLLFRFLLLTIISSTAHTALNGQYTPFPDIIPTPGSTFENQVGQPLNMQIRFVSSQILAGGVAKISLSWTNPDSPLLSEILLSAEDVTFNSSGVATLTYTFPGDYWRLDSTGDYSFRAFISGGSVVVMEDTDNDPDTPAVPVTYTWSSAQTTFTYHVPENGMPPTSLITYPQSGATFVPGQTITITADAYDGDGGITRVDFLLGNNLDTVTGNETNLQVLGTDDEPPYSTTFTIPGEGEFKLSARAFDEHGNSGRSPIVTFFGSYTPVLEELTSVTMLTPMDGSTLSCTNPITFSVDVQPASLRPMVTVDYFVNGYRINSDPVTAANISGFFNFAWDKPYIGTHSITARAQLSNGTFVETSNAADVTIVGIGSAPDVTLSVTDGDNRVVGSNARFYVHASDSGALINTLYFCVNGVVYDTISDASALGSFPYTFDFNFPAPGPYNIWVLSESSNGNRGISNVIEMEVGLGAPPSVTVISPIEGNQFLPGTEIPFLVQANDPNSLIDTIQYFVNDTLIATGVREIDGVFTVNGDTPASVYTYYFQYSGDYRLYAQAMDGSGIISTSNIVTVRVRELDPTKPTVIMSHPLPVGGGDTVNDVSVGSSMFLNAIATDGDGTIKYVSFYINGQFIGSTVTKYNDTYSLFYRPITPGAYIMYAEAVDNDNKRSQSIPLQLNVFGLEAQLPIVTMLPLASDVVDAGTQVTLRATADGGLVEVSQINFYVNGVLIGGDEEADENGVYEETVILNQPGTLLLNARAVEIDPLGLATDNWVISDSIGILVENSSSNRGFIARSYEDIVGISPGQTYVDQQVVALDNGQKTQAQYIYELMQQDDFVYTEHALMARYLLSGAWPNRNVLMLDRSVVYPAPVGETETSEDLESLVVPLLTNFQINFWDGRPIPDAFSSNSEYEDFVRILFNNKYGQNPTGDQMEQLVRMLRFYGSELFVSEFIKDTEASNGIGISRSIILGVPNPPSPRILSYARTASLFINLLRVTPSMSDIETLSGLPLIQRIETILADPRYASR